MFCEDFFFREKNVLDAQSVSVRRYSYRATNEEAVEFDQGVSFNGPVQIDTYLIDTVCKKGVLYGIMSHSYASPPCRSNARNAARSPAAAPVAIDLFKAISCSLQFANDSIACMSALARAL
jgi:hypothetical protein